MEALPYIALDLEEVAEDYVRVEYTPNRPDLATEWGVARALNGLLGYEKGAPLYRCERSGLEAYVDASVAEVRPYFVGMVVEGLLLDDEGIRQVIALQEDLHHGVGRRRRKVAIGLHNLDVVKPPFTYTTKPADFSFIPLGYEEPMSISTILRETDVGRQYGHIVAGPGRYPIILDSLGQVLSFPPIINGELTRVTPTTRNLFIDVTGTDLEAVQDALAVLATTFHDAGARILSVSIHYPNGRVLETPNLEPQQMEVDEDMVRHLLGLELDRVDIIECLARSRISCGERNGRLVAVIPRYRLDILHPVDLVEEVAVGYGIGNFTPTLPEAAATGLLHPRLEQLDTVREVLMGLGLLETFNFSLLSEEVLYTRLGRRADEALRVADPKTREHEILRDLLTPSLLQVLARNIHEEYPQRIFEVAKTFHRDEAAEAGVREDYHVAVLVAHSQADYTEAKALLTALLKQAFDHSAETRAQEYFLYTPGRSAEVLVEGLGRVGWVGEVRPEILEAFQLRTPVAGFELSLEPLLRKT